MKKILAIALFFCILCGITISFINARKIDAGGIQDVSMIQLIANPEKFHQAPVRVIGFAIIEFEGTAIYLSREFAEHGLTKNAVWIDVQPLEQFEQYDKKYVLVEGVFDKDDRGHLNLFSGCLKHISRIEEWE